MPFRKTETIVKEYLVEDPGVMPLSISGNEARVIVVHSGGSYDKFVPLSALGKGEQAFRAALDLLRKLALSDYTETEAVAEVKAKVK